MGVAVRSGIRSVLMISLLTWPTYGTWFATSRRGWIDRDGVPDAGIVPEPTRHARAEPVWAVACLDTAQRELVIRDLGRIASLRNFELHMAAVAADHVHVLLSVEPPCDVPRLVQLIKGSLSRTLTAAAGDTPATSRRGSPLPHHKWWSRQYSLFTIDNRRNLDDVTAVLADHASGDATVWRAVGWPDAARL